MAYRNFSEALSFDAQSVLQTAPAETRGFSALEWSVVALAQRDRLSSLSEPGRLSLALGALFGIRADNRLADTRLEALRRLAVHAWHRSYAVPVSEIKRFLAAGFSKDQLETLLASVSSGRRQPRRSAFA